MGFGWRVWDMWSVVCTRVVIKLVGTWPIGLGEAGVWFC